MARIKKGTFGAGFDLWDTDRDTGIEVERTADEDKIRFSIGGLLDSPIVWSSTEWIFNDNNEDVDMRFKGVTNDSLFFIDSSWDALGLGTDEITFPFQQVGGSPFTSNPRVLIEVGPDGNDTGFVMRSLSDTASKGGLVEFLRARAGLTLPQQFDTVGGFRAAGWDGVKYIGGTGLFFGLDFNSTLDYMPIGLDFRTGDGVSASYVILKGTSGGNCGLRTSTPSAPITAEGSAVFNFSHVDADFRVCGLSMPFAISVDAGTSQIGIGGASSGSAFRYDESTGRININRLKGDIDFQVSSTSYNKIFNMDAGLNIIGFGMLWGSEWLIARASGLVINETGIDYPFRVEGVTDQNLLYTQASTDRVGIGTSTPSVKLDINGDTNVQGNLTADEYITGLKTGVFASLDSSASTTITTALTYYAINGTFTNDPFENFAAATVYTPGIKYSGELTQYFEVDWHASVSADVANTTVYLGISKNGTIRTGSVMSQFCKNAGQTYNISGTAVVSLAQDDEIQLTVSSDGNGDVITFENYTTTICEFFD